MDNNCRAILRNNNSVWEAFGNSPDESKENLLKILTESEPSDLIDSAIALVENGIRFGNWMTSPTSPEFFKFDLEYGKFTLRILIEGMEEYLDVQE